MTDAEEHSPEEAEDPADGALSRARAYLAVDRTALARRELERALGESPHDFRLLWMLASVEMHEQRWPAAEERLAQALRIAPDMPALHCALAHVLSELGRYPQAEKAVLEGLRLEPTLAYGYETYARIMNRTGHLPKAAQLLRKALELDPESDSAHQMLALVESEQNRSKAAAFHAKEGLRSAPDEAHSHLAESARLLRVGRPFAARRVALEALRIDPADESLRELYLLTDRCCRWVYLPMYYWSLAVDRIPGKNIGAWILFLIFALTCRALDVQNVVVQAVAVGYLLLAVYTWFADALVNLWLRVRPPP